MAASRRELGPPVDEPFPSYVYQHPMRPFCRTVKDAPAWPERSIRGREVLRPDLVHGAAELALCADDAVLVGEAFPLAFRIGPQNRGNPRGFTTTTERNRFRGMHANFVFVE